MSVIGQVITEMLRDGITKEAEGFSFEIVMFVVGGVAILLPVVIVLGRMRRGVRRRERNTQERMLGMQTGWHPTDRIFRKYRPGGRRK